MGQIPGNRDKGLWPDSSFLNEGKAGKETEEEEDGEEAFTDL